MILGGGGRGSPYLYFLRRRRRVCDKNIYIFVLHAYVKYISKKLYCIVCNDVVILANLYTGVIFRHYNRNNVLLDARLEHHLQGDGGRLWGQVVHSVGQIEGAGKAENAAPITEVGICQGAGQSSLPYSAN